MAIPSWAQTVCLLTSQCNPPMLAWLTSHSQRFVLPYPFLLSLSNRPATSQAFTQLLSLSLFSSKCHKNRLSFRMSDLINIVSKQYAFHTVKLYSRIEPVSIICNGLREECIISLGGRSAFLRVSDSASR